MKKKTISVSLFRSLIKPNEEMTFSDISPFPGLSIPPETGQFIVWHGVTPVVGVSSVCGTTYTCRLDQKDSLPLNWDVHSIRVDKTNELELKKVKVDYHWSADLPSFIEQSAPVEIKTKIADLLESVLNSEHGIDQK